MQRIRFADLARRTLGPGLRTRPQPKSTFRLCRQYSILRTSSNVNRVAEKSWRSSARLLHRSLPAAGDELVVNLPALAESITEGEIATFEVDVGDFVKMDDPVVMVETDKTTVPVTAPADGIIEEYLVEEGDTVGLDAPLFRMTTGVAPPEGAAAPSEAPAEAAAPAPAAPAPAAPPTPAPAAPAPAPAVAAAAAPAAADAPPPEKEGVSRVKMSPMRRAIARRLKDSQNTAAFLTTFNEIDMSGIMAMRSKYKEEFQEKHGVKLGFMSAFCKAAATAAAEIPAVTAYIDGNDMVYHDYTSISVAVATPKGLVTPVLHNIEKKSFADIEKNLMELATKAREGQIALEDMDGANFTISNGGSFGSLMGTPIINQPQSAILGMHGIFKRPVAVNDEVVIRPMMYVALTYDHRIIDGREAVTFLRRIKEAVEDPFWMLMG